MRSSTRTTTLILLSLLPLASATRAQDMTERRYGDYVIHITGGQDIGEKGELEILKNGQRVYDAKKLGYAFEDDPPAGADLLGTGEPILVIDGYSGGAHCCHSDLLFALGDRFRCEYIAGR